jgi:hypothetical protein
MKALYASLLAGLVAVAAGCGGSRHAFATSRPPAADPSTARVVATANTLRLWVAGNGTGELCVGWRLGAGRPSRYRCQLRGLERPVLWVQAGGGQGASRWGSAVGLAAPGITRVLVDFTPVRLTRVPHLHGWRAFAYNGFPPSLDAYAGSVHALTDAGFWARGGGAYAYVPQQQSGPDGRAAQAALALPGVRSVLTAHGPAWLGLPARWGKCTGGAIGEVVPIHLAKAATFRTTVPFVDIAPAGRKVAYTSGVHRVLAVHSDELDVYVDSHTSRAVGVDVSAMSGAAVPLGTVSRARPGGGYDDPSACPRGGD